MTEIEDGGDSTEGFVGSKARGVTDIPTFCCFFHHARASPAAIARAGRLILEAAITPAAETSAMAAYPAGREAVDVAFVTMSAEGNPRPRERATRISVRRD
jgi:hypothetical protein